MYEDNHLLVAEKPQGLLTQSDSTGRPDLLSLCKEYIKNKYNKPGAAYLGLVHRLDRATGGVVIFARTTKAASRLSEQFRTGSVQKSYTALLLKDPVAGGLPGQLIDNLSKDKDRKKAIHAQPGTEGKKAVLTWEPGGRVLYGQQTLYRINVFPETGRFHQIRFQFASRGYPLAGDVKYGAPQCKLVEDYTGLWAHSVVIEHPVQKKQLSFFSNPPPAWTADSEK